MICRWETLDLLLSFILLSVLPLGYAKNKQLAKRNYDLVIPKPYFSQDPPLSDGPTVVHLGIYINSFYSISEQTMDYSVNIYLRQSWNDPRLRYKSPNNVEKVKLEAAWKELWVPDTFFRNEKRSGFHSVTVDNRFVTVTPNGTVWYVMKITATLSCLMTLHKYPMDTQICPMTFESFGYTMDTVQFAWMDIPVSRDKYMMTLPQFTYERYDLFTCSHHNTSNDVPCIEVRFTLRRDLGYYMIQVYVPSILIVILSWVSFWINVDAAPARVSLGLLTVLTTTTQSSGINATLPRVSYVKAIDVWMSVCLLFVFTALLEYAFVNASMRSNGRGRGGRAAAGASAEAGRQINASPRRLQLLPGQFPSSQRRNCDIEAVHHDEIEKNSSKECSSCLKPATHRFEREEAGIGGSLVSPQSQPLPPQSQPLPPLTHPPTKATNALDGKARAQSIDKLARKSFPLAFILFNIVYWIGYTFQK